MATERNYFLGYGERLTDRVSAPAGGMGPDLPYTIEEAVARLAPRVAEAAKTLEQLPDAACPQGQAVAVMTMHPQSIAKSYFPGKVLNQFGLWHVGSRPITIKPEQWTRKAEVVSTPSTDLFIAGPRSSFQALAESLKAGQLDLPEDLQRIEDIRTFATGERVRGVREGARRENTSFETGEQTAHLEVVLHAADTEKEAYVVEAFAEFAEQLGVEPRLDKRLYAGGLCFVPVSAPIAQVDQLGEFSFLRVTRPVSRLRKVNNLIERSVPSPGLASAPLPAEGPLDPDFRIAVFDGGLAEGTALSPWAIGHETDGIGSPVGEYLEHGHDVTSAVLFGSLIPGQPAPRPYFSVDHFRVLDEDAVQDPFELYDVLGRIQTVLADRRYEFFNLSLGPHSPTEDDEVHPWTAILDEYLADGRSLATVAVGNCGETAEPRIQIPSDCVNGVSVGATDSTRSGWRRAPYSATGPGRSPGLVKPDLVDFGGSGTEPFLVYGDAPALACTAGTSFSSPGLLRRAAGLRAHFGSRLSPLAIKALLIHAADAAEHPREEVGWGRTAPELDEVAVCDDGVVRVIYQGELTPSQYLRAVIPTPQRELAGKVTIRATFSYATPVDPEDPGAYTRSGLEVTFRPHSQKFSKDDAIDPTPKPFFKRSNFDPEQELRRDAQKWETVLHHEQKFFGTSLDRPVFDIHYNAREGSAPSRSAERIRYALVVDLISPRTPDLYNRVSSQFAGQLEALVPVIGIPVQVQT